MGRSGFERAVGRAVGAFVLPWPAAIVASQGWELLSSRNGVSLGSLLLLVFAVGFVLAGLQLTSGVGSPKRVLLWFCVMIGLSTSLSLIYWASQGAAGIWQFASLCGGAVQLGLGAWAAWKALKLRLPETIDAAPVDAGAVLNYAGDNGPDVIDIVRRACFRWAAVALLLRGLAFVGYWGGAAMPSGRGDLLTWVLYLGSLSGFVATLILSLRLRWRPGRRWPLMVTMVSAVVLSLVCSWYGYWDLPGKDHVAVVIGALAWDSPFPLMMMLLPESRYEVADAA